MSAHNEQAQAELARIKSAPRNNAERFVAAYFAKPKAERDAAKQRAIDALANEVSR